MCSFELTERGRRNLGLIICIIDGFLAISGASVAAMGIYLNSHLESKMQFLHGYDTGTVPYFLFIVGVTMFLSGSLFSKAAFDSAFPESRERFQSFLVFFLAAKFILIWTVFSGSMLCFTHRSVIEESLKNGLFSVMKLYKKDMELKVLIDKLQIDYKCCGTNRFEDWFTVSWVNEDFLDVEDKHIKSKMTAGLYMGDDVPFSCCHVYSNRPCIHHNVTKGSRSKYKPTLNTQGCAGTLMNFFESSILEPSGYFILMTFFVQMLSTLLLRYLHTSIDDAALMEPLGPGTASLCPNIGAGDAMKYVKSDEEALFFEEIENHQNGGQCELQNFQEFEDTDHEDKSGLEMMSDFQFGKSKTNESSGKGERTGEKGTQGDSSDNKNKSKHDGKEADKKENIVDRESGKGAANSEKVAADEKVDKGKDTKNKGNAVEKNPGGNAIGNEKNAKDNKVSTGKDTEKKGNTVDKKSGKVATKSEKDAKCDKNEAQNKKGKSGGETKAENTSSKKSNKEREKSHERSRKDKFNKEQELKSKSSNNRDKSSESKAKKNKSKSPVSKPGKHNSKSPGSKSDRGKTKPKSPTSKSGKSKSKSPGGKKSKSPKSKTKKCKSESPKSKSGKGKLMKSKSSSPKRKSKSPARKSPKMKSPRRKGRRPKLGRR